MDGTTANDARVRTGFADLLDALRSWRLWTKFANDDLRARFRRSWVGPFWLVLTTIIFVGALSLVYSTLFKADIRNYMPFVAVGVVVWWFISAVASESVVTFVEAESFIRQVRLNLFVYVFRVVWRNALVFAHHFVVALATVFILAFPDLRLLPLAAVGVLLLLQQGLWLAPLLGLIGTRFRDLHPIISSLLQVMFFVTPIMWSPSLLGDRQWIADFNPLHSLIAVVRDPLLGTVPGLATYAIVLGMTLAGFLLAILAYGKFKARVVYWL
jgi:ABC-type polysaccharide/polyol phosphate export permease